MKSKFLLQGLCVALLCSSCYYNDRLIYLQGKQFSKTKTTTVKTEKPIYHVQPNDVLSVKVKSTTEAEGPGGISSTFNVSSTTSSTFFTNPGTLYLEGYSINSEGMITLPIVGTIRVAGLTLEEVQSLVQTNINKYLNNATVFVKLLSYKIIVLGEVRNPGYYYAFNNQVTILEALGLAGDLTITGNRKNVKLIRQIPGGGNEVALLDLTDANLLTSSYFYLMPNDVLYVEPLQARTRRSNLDVATVAFSAITTAVLVLTYVNNQNNN
jgi:polysaccharide export outer membrane protein